MKIYVEPLGEIVEIEQTVEKLMKEIPDDMLPEIKNVIATLSNLATHFYRKYMIQHQQTAKLRCMWSLRELKDEIDAENGNIVITKDSKVNINGFSPQLTQKINDVAEGGYKE